MKAMETANQPIVPGVYLVTDVRLYREGLVSSLSRYPGIEVLGAGTRADAVRAMCTLRPDVVMLDLSSRDSLTLAQQVSPMLPALRIVALAVTDFLGGRTGLRRGGDLWLRDQGGLDRRSRSRGSPGDQWRTGLFREDRGFVVSPRRRSVL